MCRSSERVHTGKCISRRIARFTIKLEPCPNVQLPGLLPDAAADRGVGGGAFSQISPGSGQGAEGCRCQTKDELYERPQEDGRASWRAPFLCNIIGNVGKPSQSSVNQIKSVRCSYLSSLAAGTRPAISVCVCVCVRGGHASRACAATCPSWLKRSCLSAI